MLNRQALRAAQLRYIDALYNRHAVTGLRSGADILKKVAARTGIPATAILCHAMWTAGEGDALARGAASIRAHRARVPAAGEALSLVMASTEVE